MRVVGVEPEAGDDTARSLAAGERVHIDVPRTIADGLQAAEPGELTFAVNRELVDEIVTVSDDRDRRRDGVPVRPDEARRRAERRGRRRGAARRPRSQASGSASSLSGGNVGAARFAELARAATEKPATERRRDRALGGGDRLLAVRDLPEHPAAQQLVDAAVEDDRRERRVEVGAELAASPGRAR